MNKFTLIFSLIFLISSRLLAQVQITGRVKDKDGQPIPGVNIVVKATTKGTFTDVDGNYKLVNVPKDSTLVFSFIGMVSEEIKVGDQTEINVTMLEDITSLEDVVVVGYGIQKRVNLTGAVTNISAKDIQDIPSGNLSTTLEGRLAGVQISLSSGKPGASTTLKIRESTSFGTVAEVPLYVIDNIIRDKDAFDLLDPSEVESISILKDASAAVFGVKSAGGVVLVQTKKGKQGKIKVNYSTSYGITEPINTTKMLSAYDHAKMLNDGYDIQNLRQDDPSRYAQDELDYYRDSIPNGGYDWLKKAWKNARVSRHNLNLSGGSEKMRYFVGGSYLKETGSIQGLYASRYSIRSNLEMDVLKGLTSMFEISLGNRDERTPINPMDTQTDLMEETFRALLQNPKWIPPTINNLPVYQNGIISNNPYAIWLNNEYNKEISNTSSLTASLEYKTPFIKGLSVKAQINQSKTNSTGKTYYEKAYGYNFQTSGSKGHILKPDAELLHDSAAINVYSRSTISGKEYIEESTEQSVTYQIDGSLAYSNKFGRHDISAMAICEIGQSDGHRVGYQRQGAQVIPGSDMAWAFQEGQDRVLSTNAFETGSVGYIGRLNYNFGSKYIAELSCRYDASSKFSPKERWGFFPAVSLGYVVSEENFFKNSISFINFFKIRASAGLLGNDGVRDFLWMYSFGTANGLLFGNQPVSGAEVKNAGLINPDISWQKTKSYNGGLDFKFWESKITLSVDAFYKYTYDILASVTSTNPTTVGIPTSTNIRFNYGKMHAYGYEIELGYEGKFQSGFDYSLKGNFAWAEAMKLKVAQSPGAIGRYDDQLKNPVDNQPGAICTGMVRDQSELEDILMDNPNYKDGNNQQLELGMLNYKDIRGVDGSEGPNGQYSYDPLEDRTIIARHTSPPYSYGLSLGLGWKGLSIDMTFSGKFGHKELFDKEATAVPTSTENVPAFWADHWTADNPDAALPRAYNYGLVGENSTFWMRNGHTLRLTDLNVSYKLPAKWAERFGVPQLRLFFDTRYLWTIINPFDYKDANLSDYNGYPMTRTYNFGLNVSF
jgi:TonB-linked SusC/RagA family outer membrane protein